MLDGDVQSLFQCLRCLASIRKIDPEILIRCSNIDVRRFCSRMLKTVDAAQQSRKTCFLTPP